MKLYPSILTSSIEEAQAQLDKIKDNSQFEAVQFDIVDGYYADNLTISPLDVLNLDLGDLKVDFHLMVEEPMDSFLEIEALAERLPIRAVIAQIEKMSFQEDFLSELKRRNWQAGLSLDLFTPIESLDLSRSCLQYLDILQIMGVEAGFQGQKISDLVWEKLEEAMKLQKRFGAEWEILIDGGVKMQNAKKLIRAGATGLVVGSELWQAENIDEAVSKYF